MNTTQKRLQTGDKVGPLKRSFFLERGAAPEGGGKRAITGFDETSRTLALSFSSDAPVDRWFGNEVLSHARGSADLSRLNDGAPLLFNHNMDDLIGVVENARMGDDGKGYAVVRFAKTARGDEVMSLVADGIVRNVSFMYQASDYDETDEGDAGRGIAPTYTANKWQAYEISMVSIPADNSVGVGRSASTEQSVTVHQRTAAPATEPTGSNPAATAATSAAIIAAQPSGEKTMSDAKQHTGGSAATAADPAEILAQERARVAAIRELGTQHKVDATEVSKMIDSGMDLSAARGLVLNAVLSRNTQAPVANLGGSPGDVGMSNTEKRSYSILRALNALATGDWSKAGFEREVSAALAKRTGKESSSSFFMPADLPFAPTQDHARAYMQVMGKRSMQMRAPTSTQYQVGVSASGGSLVEETLMADQFVEVLRNNSVTAQLGARYLTDLVGNIDLPRQDTQTSVGWVGESVAGAESEATFDRVQLRPKTITANSIISRLMMLQSTPAIEMLVRADLLAATALGLDYAALLGAGTNNSPTGIANQANVASVIGGANGANLTFDHLIQLESQPAIQNAPQANLGYAFNAKVRGWLATQKSTTGQYLWSQDGGVDAASPRTIRGIPYALSNQLPYNLTKGTSSGNCSALIYGNWQELIIGMWGVMEIAINPYESGLYEQGDVKLRIMQTADVQLRHGQSFAVMTDALTPGF